MSKVAEAMELLGTGILNGIRKRAVVTAKFPALVGKVPDGIIEIEEFMTVDDVTEYYQRLTENLQDQPLVVWGSPDHFPIANALGGMSFSLDLAVWPERRVIYEDWDFGIFDLGPLDEFLSKLE
jgi:hypothetical protein